MTVFAQATILVLEHEGGLRSLACRVLAGQAYHVLEAADGSQACETAATEATIDLLICDVDVAQIRARTLVTAIRLFHPELDVVFSSARTDRELLTRGFDIGIDHLLKRPFNGTQLMDAVRAALRFEPLVSLDLR
ncbi:MAG TPA: response regulator [Gemmatimonadaceae bacterium]|nr:response regulator [Gemmatimonadaceae bacterium]